LEELDEGRENNIKMGPLEKRIDGEEWVLLAQYGELVSSCKHGNEPSDSIT